VNRFDENDIQDIEGSITKYEQLILPGIDDDIEIIRQNIMTTDAGTVRDVYKAELIKKLKDRHQYREALIGYQQLRTWYYENK